MPRPHPCGHRRPQLQEEFKHTIKHCASNARPIVPNADHGIGGLAHVLVPRSLPAWNEAR